MRWNASRDVRKTLHSSCTLGSIEIGGRLVLQQPGCEMHLCIGVDAPCPRLEITGHAPRYDVFVGLLLISALNESVWLASHRALPLGPRSRKVNSPLNNDTVRSNRQSADGFLPGGRGTSRDDRDSSCLSEF